MLINMMSSHNADTPLRRRNSLSHLNNASEGQRVCSVVIIHCPLNIILYCMRQTCLEINSLKLADKCTKGCSPHRVEVLRTIHWPSHALKDANIIAARSVLTKNAVSAFVTLLIP